MVDYAAIRNDVDEEVSTILSGNFNIDVTETSFVPHSDDGSITFPNLDQKTQGTKIIETTVLYVDMRRSTELSLKHHSHTVAKLYSAFVRGMTRCAAVFGGEVRGIIGDRVMILFNSVDCFTAAVDTAKIINSVCQYIINKHFKPSEISFGIGIDYGRMLATKTGVRRHGSARQSYRSLVWLGRPANIASKLTDHANKPAEFTKIVKLKVAYQGTLLGGVTYMDEYPHIFTRNFYFDTQARLMRHTNPNFHSFTSYEATVETKALAPPILMTQRVYDGFRAVRPTADEIAKGWFSKVNIKVKEYDGQIYGGDVIYIAFRDVPSKTNVA